MSHFIVTDRKTAYLLPPSLDDWLNEDHLARFVVEVVDQFDLSDLTRRYAGRDLKDTIQPRCWRSWCMAMRLACSPAASCNVPPMIQLLSATLPPAAILTTTRWLRCVEGPMSSLTCGAGAGACNDRSTPIACITALARSMRSAAGCSNSMGS